VRVGIVWPRTVDANANAGAQGYELRIGGLKLLAFKIERLPEFSGTSRLNPAFTNDVRREVNLAAIRVREDGSIKTGRGGAHLDMQRGHREERP